MIVLFGIIAGIAILFIGYVFGFRIGFIAGDRAAVPNVKKAYTLAKSDAKEDFDTGVGLGAKVATDKAYKRGFADGKRARR